MEKIKKTAVNKRYIGKAVMLGFKSQKNACCLLRFLNDKKGVVEKSYFAPER